LIKKVTLVKPPERSPLNFGVFSLAVLAASMEEVAKIKIVDATDFSIDEAVRVALKAKPEIIGITTMALSSVDPSAEFANALRNAGFSGMLVAGGHGASMQPLKLLRNGADAVVYGEGELTFREILVLGVSENLHGLYLFRDGKLVKTPPRKLLDINSLVAPDQHLNLKTMKGMAMLETSRGCPHSCTFCEATRFYCSTWRGRSPEKVIEDVQKLVNKGADIIQISDDNFLASPERALRICDLLVKGSLPLFFIFSARSDDLIDSPELIPSLAKAHFLRANVGVETIEGSLSKRLGKDITFEQHRQAFERMKEAGIYTVASFIVGLPGETEIMRQKYVSAATNLADSARFLPFLPLPGTPLGNVKGEPDRFAIEYANRMNGEFDRDPVVLKRLLDAAGTFGVRGMLARASLKRRLMVGSLEKEKASFILTSLNKMACN